MQLYVITWRFESSEDQIYAEDAFKDYIQNGKADEPREGYERLFWVHTPQDGTGVIICRAANSSVLYRVFSPWRRKFGMVWDYKPALTTEELIQLIEEIE